METDTDEGGSCKKFTDLPRICYRSPTEHYGDPRTGLQMSCSVLTVFLIRKPFPCQSVEDPAMFWAIFVGSSVSDERDATRTSRMGIRTIRTLTDEDGYRVRTDFPEKSSMFDSSVMV